MKFLTLFLIFITGIAFSGCEDSWVMRKIREKKQATAPAPAQQPQKQAPKEVLKDFVAQTAKTPAKVPETVPSEDTQASQGSLQEKINAYVECLNRTAGRLHQSHDRYLSWVNKAAGPSCQERYISYGLYELYADGIQKCRQAVEKGKQLSPALPKLDDDMERLTEVFARMVPLVSEAASYYRQQDYKDDACAKAKELHPKLIAGFEEFMALEKEIDRELTPKKRELDLAELTRLQAAGKKLQAFSKKFLMSAEVLMDTLPQGGQPNQTNYLKSFGQVDVDYQNLHGYVVAHTEESQSAFMFSSYESAAEKFYTQAKIIKRELSDGKPVPARELNTLIRDYNSLVSRGNSLRF